MKITLNSKIFVTQGSEQAKLTGTSFLDPYGLIKILLFLHFRAFNLLKLLDQVQNLPHNHVYVHISEMK